MGEGKWKYTECLWDEGAERNDNMPFTPETMTFTAALEYLEVLYVRFPEPEAIWDDEADEERVKKFPPVRRHVKRPDGKKMPDLPESPDPKKPFQVAFQVLVKIHGLKNEETIHEILGTSGLMRNALCELYEEYRKQKDQHPGEAPIVKNTGFREVRTNKGVSRRPILEIIG
jgi:hypothetical protein